MDNQEAPPPNIPENNNHHNANEENINTNKKYLFWTLSLIILFLSVFLYYKYYIQYNKNIEKEEKKNFSNIKEKKPIKDEDTLLKNRNSLKKNFMRYLEYSRVTDTIENQEIINKINLWKNITYPYLDIDRFTIAVMSTISAGKSSLLNYILNLKNILQIGEKITTKFCLIIRHNKNYKNGKIFNVKIQKRAEINKYNFIKGDEIKEEPKIFIEKRNKKLEMIQKESKETAYDPELYFAILEIDTGLFDGEFEKYSSLVEFIDLPGLNEVGTKNNFYFRNILPFIKPNLIFPLIILDADKFQSSDVFDVFKELFQPYISKFTKEIVLDRKAQYDLENQKYMLNILKNNSLFIINKLNLFDSEERRSILNNIIEKTSLEFKVEIKLNKNCFEINAKAKNLEVSKFENFLNYIKYVINYKDLEENIELKDLISNQFKNDFNFTVPENLDELAKKAKNAEGYQDFYELMSSHNILIGKKEKSQSYYNYFSHEFGILKQKNLKFELDGIKIKNEIKNKIKFLINEYLEDKILNELLNYFNINATELKEDFSKYIIAKDPIDIIKLLESPVKELYKIGGSNVGISQLNKDYDSLINFLQNNQFLHFLISGPYSSGKTFLLNNIIGYNLYLLEYGRGETTNHAFIVRYSNEINLYEAHLQKNKVEYFFEKGRKLASGKENVIKKVKEINHYIKNFSYFILETPIQVFDNIYGKNISIKHDLINQIEIIDYPGLDTSRAKKGNYTKNDILQIISGFIFLIDPKEIGSNRLMDVLESIIRRFVFENSNIEDLENCLFLLTKNNKNEQSDFYNLNTIEQTNNLLKKLKEEAMDYPDIYKIENKLNDSTIKFAKFSNIDYKEYINKTEKLNSFKYFIYDIIKTKIQKIKKKDFKSLYEYIDMFIEQKYNKKNKEEKKNYLNKIFSWFLEDNNKIEAEKNIKLLDINSYLNNFKEILIGFKFINKEYIFNNNDNQTIIKYAKKYENLKSELKNDIHLERSFYKEFETKFKEILNNSYNIIINKFNKYLNDFILEVQAVIQTINSIFNMSQNEFERKYSDDVKNRIIHNITNRFDAIKVNLKKEISDMKEAVKRQILNLKCDESDPDIFKYNFLGIKQNINNIIEWTSRNIQIIYSRFQNLITNLIVNFQTNENSEEKDKIISIETIKIDRFFRNDINFHTISYFAHKIVNFFGWFVGYEHDYQDDIKRTCNEYTNMIYSGYEDIYRNLFEKFEELNNKGIEIINLIFNTAHSNFEELKKNIINYDRIIKTIQNIFKNNNLDK